MQKHSLDQVSPRSRPPMRGRCRMCGIDVVKEHTICPLCDRIFARLRPSFTAESVEPNEPLEVVTLDADQFDIVVEEEPETPPAFESKKKDGMFSVPALVIGFLFGAVLGVVFLSS